MGGHLGGFANFGRGPQNVSGQHPGGTISIIILKS